MSKKERSLRDRESFPQRRRTPSFSSSLLDAIYHSIDESKSGLDENHEVGVSKQSNFSYKQSVYMEKGGKVRMNLRRAVMMENWMEKQSSLLFNSSSSSSECSSRAGGAAFSFLETEISFRKLGPKLKSESSQKHEKPKKVKQPISPGSRIARFLSSIFNSGNVKKAKMCYVGAAEDVGGGRLERKSKSPSLSSSSVSSFSCMRKTPKGKKSSNGKRCVRFYPGTGSVILGENENSQPYQNDPNRVRKFSRNSPMKKVKSCTVIAKENRGADSESTRGELNFRGFYDRRNEKEVDEEDDDVLSCSSSDLFELDHLIGTARYREELPVYETTSLETNKAIANGLRL